MQRRLSYKDGYGKYIGGFRLLFIILVGTVQPVGTGTVPRVAGRVVTPHPPAPHSH